MPYGYSSVRQISPRQARTMMRANPSCTVLDVRSRSEYNSGHIPKAVCLPDNEISTRAPYFLPDKKSLILVYCKGGSRSREAATSLVSMGYTNVYDIGGINSWPYEIV